MGNVDPLYPGGTVDLFAKEARYLHDSCLQADGMQRFKSVQVQLCTSVKTVCLLLPRSSYTPPSGMTPEKRRMRRSPDPLLADDGAVIRHHTSSVGVAL